ncbi:DNA (cytosine-5-)-methyltransferase, partial [Campylobacter jejuni]|nr:DNA (cytosine-5-)-methyltransferase [Campylobacter jejuni]
MKESKVVDLFCGVGGLSCGLKQAGFEVIAGYDLDGTCKYAYEKNIKAQFIEKNIKNISSNEIQEYFGNTKYKILVGCAPCQTFSKYTKGKNNENDEKWTLLNEFLRLIIEIKPEIIS